MRLRTRGVLALIDDATPGQLRPARLRLCAIDPDVTAVTSAAELYALPEGALVLYAPAPDVDGRALNLTRPLLTNPTGAACRGPVAGALPWDHW